MNARKHGDRPLELKPIGVVRTAFKEKVDAPRQPRAAQGVPGRIELFPGHDFEHAIEDLADWEFLWVIYWFHLNRSWRPKVLPPRSTTGRKGVFSTRSPHRPNPIGLSAVRLERVEGLTLHVRDVDMVDGTPVLDLKPYVPYTDAHPGARSGWLESAGAPAGAGPADPLTPWQVTLEPIALEQASWVQERTGLALADRIVTTLVLGPKPNPYRRIKREGQGYRLAIKDWRARFVVDERQIRVVTVFSGYRSAQLAGDATSPDDEALRAHRQFVARWPDALP
jgi:tRNA-Thr(GGU) m(6)t(6)A37 methyltransferase TsaA